MHPVVILLLLTSPVRGNYLHISIFGASKSTLQIHHHLWIKSALRWIGPGRPPSNHYQQRLQHQHRRCVLSAPSGFFFWIVLSPSFLYLPYIRVIEKVPRQRLIIKVQLFAWCICVCLGAKVLTRLCGNMDNGYAKIFTLCPVFGLQIIDETIWTGLVNHSHEI